MTADIRNYRPAWFKPTAKLNPDRTCLMCPTKLSFNVEYYCWGYCIASAKTVGMYGREKQAR